MTTPNLHGLRDKHLLTLERELRRLHKAQWNAPAVPLERPYQKGWYKTYRIPDHALKHPDSLLFQRVLPVVNQVVVSLRDDFRNRQGIPIELGTKILLQREWYRLSWPQSIQRLFSYGRWLQSRENTLWWRPSQDFLWGFKLTRDWWLEEVITPRFITHQRVDLPEVKARIAEIEAKLQHTEGFHRLDWLHGKSSYWSTRDSTFHEGRHATEEDYLEDEADEC